MLRISHLSETGDIRRTNGVCRREAVALFAARGGFLRGIDTVKFDLEEVGTSGEGDSMSL